MGLVKKVDRLTERYVMPVFVGAGSLLANASCYRIYVELYNNAKTDDDVAGIDQKWSNKSRVNLLYKVGNTLCQLYTLGFLLNGFSQLFVDGSARKLTLTFGVYTVSNIASKWYESYLVHGPSG